MKPVRVASVLVLLASVMLAGQLPAAMDWALTGPSDGAVTDIVESPAGKLFAATSKGLYQSTDDGIGWRACGDARGDFVLLLSDGRVFMGPSGTGHLSFVDQNCTTRATVQLPREFNSPRSINALARLSTGRLLASRWSIGLFASDDEGRQWRPVPLPTAPSATWLSSIVSLPSGTLIASSGGTVLRSTDNGETWTPTGAPGGFFRLAVAPSGTLFGVGDGVSRSADEGRTWTKVAFDRQTVWAMMPGRAGVPRSNSGVAFVAVQRPDRFDNAVYRSTDGGVNWTPGDSALTGRVNVFVQTNKGSLIAGTSTGFYRSGDNGASWRFHGVAPSALSVMAAGGDGIVVAGTPGGWISTDNGRTWLSTVITYQESDRFSNTGEHYPRGFLITRAGRIFSGGQNGVVLSLNRGQSWRRVGLRRDTQALRELADGTIVAATYDGGIFRSADQGETWTEHSIGLTEFNAMRLSVLSSGHVVAATLHQVFISTDSAKSWQPLTTGFPHSALRPVLPSGVGAVGIAGVDATVYQLDDTRTWKAAGTTRSPITSLAWDDLGRLWVGTRNDGVAMARQVGDAWTIAYVGLPGEPINALAVSQGYIVAATAHGIYRAALPRV